MTQRIKLKMNKEHLVYTKHPWIFSDSLEISADVAHGEWVNVVDSMGRVVASGSYSATSMFKVRVFEFGTLEEPTIDWWETKLHSLEEYRNKIGYGKKTDTTGYRLVHSESDSLPGLIIDRYNDTFVIQSSTQFIDDQLEIIVEAINNTFKAKCVFNKSEIQIRKGENLEAKVELISGKLPKQLLFKENGFDFVSEPETGQKTGFFLDQKDLRKNLSNLESFVKGKNVLNLFSYSASTSVYLLKAGAKSVHNVDQSEIALDSAAVNAELNNIPLKKFSCEKADAFDWLESNQDKKFDIVIIDPPALVKGFKHKERGLKAYHFLNKLAMKIVNKGGLFVTSSCSHFLEKSEFDELLRKASNQSGITLRAVNYVGQSPDHPISVYFPEGQYLKSYIFNVT